MIAIQPPVDLDDAEVEVQLRDTRMADAASTIVARTIQRCSGVGLDRVVFRLDATVDPAASYTVAAEVRRGERLAPGDLMSVASHPWRADDGGPLTIAVKPVS